MNTKRFIISVLIVSVIWFIFPIIVYSLFVMFFDLTSPSGFSPIDLVISIPLSFLHGFAFVLIFFLAKGSKIGQSGLLYGFLWWLGAGVVWEVGFWLLLKFSLVTMLAGLAADLCLLVNGIIVEKLSKYYE